MKKIIIFLISVILTAPVFAQEQSSPSERKVNKLEKALQQKVNQEPNKRYKKMRIGSTDYTATIGDTSASSVYMVYHPLARQSRRMYENTTVKLRKFPLDGRSAAQVAYDETKSGEIMLGSDYLDNPNDPRTVHYKGVNPNDVVFIYLKDGGTDYSSLHGLRAVKKGKDMILIDMTVKLFDEYQKMNSRELEGSKSLYDDLGIQPDQSRYKWAASYRLANDLSRIVIPEDVNYSQQREHYQSPLYHKYRETVKGKKNKQKNNRDL